ncbi:hypothetical protein SY83_05920 [Paenibacillus swuensis]|uniref:Uncharacterized protein n=1 Tax=Paenibacillus swuensis TaxID=1178515 RepID=A0A172TFR4_9BACL|nr:Ger(x)C family spore germination protein [Paenibacillus swuensis]ANE45905.1 hypothetical protein SY83_05920 [Paenibacillus swuensis]
MKLWFQAVIVALCCILTGCADRLDLEHTSMILITGIDVSEEDNNDIQVFSKVLQFDEDASKKETNLSNQSKTLREARTNFNSESSGIVVAGKTQIFVVSKALLRKKDLYPYLDVYFRDAKNSNSALISVCDCSIKTLFEYKTPQQPVLTEYIRKLIEFGYAEEITVMTTMEKFHYMRFEKGLTPSITEIKPVKNTIKIMGTSLINSNGKCVELLNFKESALLLLLKNDTTNNMSYLFNLKIPPRDDTIQLNMNMKQGRPKIKTRYRKGKFHFDIRIPLEMEVTEVNVHIDFEKQETKLIRMIEQQLNRDLMKLIHKTQKRKIDPVGMGVYARAQQYNHFKGVQDHWTDAYGDAEFHITTDVKINRYGVIKGFVP